MATQYTAGLSVGQVLTAATMNSIGAAYETHTPTWTNLTIGNGTQVFRYGQINKLVFLYGKLTFGSTTSITGAVTFTLPVTAKEANGLGSAAFTDAGNLAYFGYCFLSSTTSGKLAAVKSDATYTTIADLSSTVPFTWGNTDELSLQLVYEAA